MRTSALTPGYAPLPFGFDYAADSRHDARLSTPDFSADAVAGFDALLHEINPDALRVNPPRLRALVRWLASLTPRQAHAVIDVRMCRMRQLRGLLDDPDWDVDPAMHARLRKLLDYVDRDDDLIPDTTPVLGLLDDVLLFELAWPAFDAEAEEYRDFCRYRQVEHPAGDGAQQRDAWVRDCLAELALLRHHARVHDSHYAVGRIPGTVFRVTG